MDPQRTPTVLNVDDSEEARYVRTRVLRQAGFEVREARTGAETLALMHSERPDAVLLDVRLPDIDGFAVCGRIKAETEQVPVIHISAELMDDSARANGLEGGADAYLVEPVAPELLVSTVRAALRSEQAHEVRCREAATTADYLRRVYGISAALAEAVTTEAVLDTITDTVLAETGADTGYIVLLSEDGRELRSARVAGYLPETAARLERVPSDAALPVADAIRSGDVILVEDDSREPRYRELAIMGPWGAGGAMAAIPLMVRGRTLGAVGLRFAGPRRFTDYERDFFVTVGRECAQALERARLYDSERGLREELEREQTRLARTQEFSLVMALHVSLDGRWLRLPQTFVRFLGYDSDQELLGTPFKDVTHPDDFWADWSQVQRLVRGEIKSFEMEKRFIRKDGSVTWGYMNCSIVTDEEGRPVHLLTYVRDMNAKKEAEEALRRSEARERARAAELEAVMEAVPYGTVVARDADCRYMIGSRTIYDFLRLPPGSNISRSAPEQEQPTGYREMKDGREIPASELPVQKAAATGQPVRDFEFQIVFEDGTTRDVLGDAVPLFGEDGRPRGAVGAFIDITDRKRTEERIRQAQKFESIGLLAGGIAHDFNNLLVGIMGNASLAEDMLPPEHPVSELLGRVVKTSEHAAFLVKQLLAYSGKGRFVIEPVDLSALSEELSVLVQPSVSKKITVQLKLDRHLPSVQADRSQMQQVFTNLVLNASEAIGDQAGEISIETGVEDVEEGAGRHTQLAPGRYVYLQVRDTGPGMDEATRAKIFDPFFTTKFTGRGLGLAAVSGIVHGHKGEIVVSTAVGKGACFRVLFPASQAAAEAPEPAAPEREEHQGTGTILVVDDEEFVRETARQGLERRGYEVLLADNGEAAVEELKRATERIGVAVLDLSMPGMSGEETLTALHQIKPNLEVLISSGYSEDEVRARFSGFRVAGFLQKPYTIGRLAEKVRETFGPRNGAAG